LEKNIWEKNDRDRDFEKVCSLKKGKTEKKKTDEGKREIW